MRRRSRGAGSASSTGNPPASSGHGSCGWRRRRSRSPSRWRRAASSHEGLNLALDLGEGGEEGRGEGPGAAGAAPAQHAVRSGRQACRARRRFTSMEKCSRTGGTAAAHHEVDRPPKPGPATNVPADFGKQAGRPHKGGRFRFQGLWLANLRSVRATVASRVEGRRGSEPRDGREVSEWASELGSGEDSLVRPPVANGRARAPARCLATPPGASVGVRQAADPGKAHDNGCRAGWTPLDRTASGESLLMPRRVRCRLLCSM